jgi:hypothetical protein
MQRIKETKCWFFKNINNIFILIFLIAQLNKNKCEKSQALVVHAYNLSYLGGRDQVDRGSKPAHAISA